MRYTQSLRLKLITPFIAGMISLTFVLVWYTYSAAQREVQNAVLSISKSTTTNTISSMSLLFRSMSTSLHNMVTDPHLMNALVSNATELDLKKATDWVEIIVRSNEFYRDVYVVDEEGVCIVSSNPSMVGKSFINQSHIRSALGGQFALGEFGVGRVTKKFTVHMAGPVDVGENVGGALVFTNDFPSIVDYTTKSASSTDHGVFATFLTPEGLFIAHNDINIMGNKSKLYPELYAELATVREQGDDVMYTLNGDTYLGYAKVEPVTNWVVVTSGEQNEVLASAYGMGITVTLISVCFLVFITICVVRFANDILNTMFSLIHYAKAVSEGDLGRDLPATERQDELGVLHMALQRLVVALRGTVEETRKASEMKGQFLANMSHEIRTPLNAVIGLTQLMLKEEGISERVRMFVEKIQISSRLLFGLINDILDLSKVEAGMIELEQIPFDLRSVVSNAVSIHQDKAEEKNLTLTCKFGPDLPEHYVGDPLRMGQVLNNLISNALKFTSTGGVTVHCVVLETLSPETLSPENIQAPAPFQSTAARVRISVTDTGVGVSPEALARLFQPFMQADSSISRQFGGTGLGLTISKRLVELMDGEIVMESELGKGSTASFTCVLELVNTTTEHDGATDETDGVLHLEGKRILVAEDNEINQLIMQEMLSLTGAEVVLANNGAEAVHAVEYDGPFDLVLMDMQMPVMDGLEATRCIRKLISSDKLPVVALTANAMKEDKNKCYASGMNAYVTKPVEIVVLMSMLRQWVH